MNKRDAVGLALATGSVALLPGGAQAMWDPGAMIFYDAFLISDEIVQGSD
ncbi:hypothetical protein [Erwinia oleae]|nr:hypothetical protein [Erwinia oleae]